MMSKNYSGWHVLYVKSQHEKKIDFLMKENNLDSFLPTVTSFRQWSDRKKKIVKPLFPSYVFLKVNSKKEFYQALCIKGVFNYIKFGKEYAKLRDDEINRIKCFLNLEGISEVNSISYVPHKGELMKINYGPLKGLNCEVVKTGNKNRIYVKMESLKKNITAIVPSVYLDQMI